jgi:MYXO-CTERM domain-containing protein
VIGVALLDGDRVVITDQNSGLYVLAPGRSDSEGASVGFTVAVVFGGLAVLVVVALLVARRRRATTG